MENNNKIFGKWISCFPKVCVPAYVTHARLPALCSVYYVCSARCNHSGTRAERPPSLMAKTTHIDSIHIVALS